MLSIVACHTNHADFDFPLHTVTLNRLWQQFLGMGGMGNDIFVLLSGYFLINSSGINFRRLFNLWIRIFFYSVVIYGLFLLFGLEQFSLKTTLKVLLPISKRQWWFASIYFVMYLIHPYVNRLLHSFSREEYRKFILAVIIYWSIIPMLTRSDFEANALIHFVCIYSFAGYVRLYPEDFVNRNYILYGLIFTGISFLSIVALDVIGTKIPYVGEISGYFLGMMRPLTLASMICFLIGFSRLNIPYSRIINTIASATFGVYLIHDNNFVRPFIWRDVFHVASYQNSPYLVPYSIFAVLVVYITCTIIELLRSKIFNTLSRGRLS